MKSAFRSTWYFASLATFAAWLGYALIFPVLFLVAQDAGVALSLLPIAIAAWLRGARAGVLTAICSVPINSALLLSVGWTLPSSFVGSLVAAFVFALVAGSVGHTRDANRRVHELTLFDQITTLPNRVAFRHDIERVLDEPHAFAVVALLRLNGFRQVNDTFGYEIGDKALREVGRRLVAAVDSSAAVARFDGATFGVLSSDPSVSWNTLAETALSVFSTALSVDGHDLQMDGRVGVAHFPDHGSSASELLLRAEAALRDAERTPTHWAVGTKVSESESKTRLDTIAALRSGLASGELRLYYQPILGVTERAASEFEALVRWQRADGRLVQPGDFIPLAERSGLIGALTDWVLDEALRQVREWRNGGRTLTVAVNVSAVSLRPSARLAGKIEELLAKHQLDARHLTIEVTETDMMADPEQAIRVLNEIKALGVHIAVDDFGTGYSSLSYLNQLPLDSVKIDRSFVKRVIRDANTATIVRAAVDLSHALGLDVVAEGVEDAELIERLTAMGCDRVQGYHIARPMPAAAVIPWLQTTTKGEAPAPNDQQRHVRSARANALKPREGTVLVVDDEHPLRVATHRILSADGFHVIHAATASEALRLCSEYEGQLDLVLSDVYLTDWRGHELGKYLRKQYPDLRVLLMSGDPQARELAAGAVLAKPFTKRELIQSVKGALAA